VIHYAGPNREHLATEALSVREWGRKLQLNGTVFLQSSGGRRPMLLKNLSTATGDSRPKRCLIQQHRFVLRQGEPVPGEYLLLRLIVAPFS
jgi:hypothetical protein